MSSSSSSFSYRSHSHAAALAHLPLTRLLGYTLCSLLRIPFLIPLSLLSVSTRTETVPNGSCECRCDDWPNASVPYLRYEECLLSVSLSDIYSRFSSYQSCESGVCGDQSASVSHHNTHSGQCKREKRDGEERQRLIGRDSFLLKAKATPVFLSWIRELYVTQLADPNEGRLRYRHRQRDKQRGRGNQTREAETLT